MLMERTTHKVKRLEMPVISQRVSHQCTAHACLQPLSYPVHLHCEISSADACLPDPYHPSDENGLYTARPQPSSFDALPYLSRTHCRNPPFPPPPPPNCSYRAADTVIPHMWRAQPLPRLRTCMDLNGLTCSCHVRQRGAICLPLHRRFH